VSLFWGLSSIIQVVHQSLWQVESSGFYHSVVFLVYPLSSLRYWEELQSRHHSVMACLVGYIWVGQAAEIQRTLVWLLVSVSGGLRGGVWLPVCLCSPVLRDVTSRCEPDCGETGFISVSREPGSG
jgi:hypothetical protein